MNKMTIQTGLEEGGWLKVTLEGGEGAPDGFDLLLAAIRYLIEEADTCLEEKTGDLDAASRLYEIVLMATARHRAVDLLHIGSQKVSDVLRALIEELGQYEDSPLNQSALLADDASIRPESS